MNKKVISIIIVAASFSASAMSSVVCERIFDETPLVSSGRFHEMEIAAPDAAHSWKRSIIVMCDEAVNFGRSGGSAENAAFIPLKDINTSSPISSLLSATSISVAMAAWQEGNKKKRETNAR